MKQSTYQLIGVTALFLAASVETEEVTDIDRFKLWNDRAPINLVVEQLPKGAKDIGLKRDAIETAVRSRLRAARLYDAEKDEFLYVNVHVMGRAFAIDFAYTKVLYDPASSDLGPATTWTSGSIGTHGSDAGYILSSLSPHTDAFIDEYLRVNKDACSRQP